MDKELGIRHMYQSTDAEQQAQRTQQAAHDGDFEPEEEGRVRLPLFTHKVMVMVQDLLQYKVLFALLAAQ